MVHENIYLLNLDCEQGLPAWKVRSLLFTLCRQILSWLRETWEGVPSLPSASVPAFLTLPIWDSQSWELQEGSSPSAKDCPRDIPF